MNVREYSVASPNLHANFIVIHYYLLGILFIISGYKGNHAIGEEEHIDEGLRDLQQPEAFVSAAAVYWDDDQTGNEDGHHEELPVGP